MRVALIVLVCDTYSIDPEEEFERLKRDQLSHMKHWRLDHSTILEKPRE